VDSFARVHRAWHCLLNCCVGGERRKALRSRMLGRRMDRRQDIFDFSAADMLPGIDRDVLAKLGFTGSVRLNPCTPGELRNASH
jgi:hypothetical protein